MDEEARERLEGATVVDPHAHATACARRAGLRVVSGHENGLERAIPDEGLMIGSKPPADLLLADPNVSRRHAEIRRAPNGYVVRDLGSTNGTYLAGVRIESAYLGHGVVLRVGHTEIVFEAHEKGVRIRPGAAGEALGLTAVSRPMRELVAAIEKFAPTDLSVVLEGETGSGKEVVARALHQKSRRATRPLVVVDCGALQENLVESELFGHERGAFTGAVEARVGAFETADGGTLFLDEVGELPLTLQPKLLRVLEAREVRRLGSDRMRSVDVRVLAATNRDLAAEVAERRFRPDLYFRLSEVRLRVPPLRKRRKDLVAIAEAIAREVNPRASFRPEALAALAARPWLGNVRELGNVVRRAVVAADPDPIGLAHLAPTEVRVLGPDSGVQSIDVNTDLPIVQAREAAMIGFKRVYLETLLERFDGDLQAVAKHAGIHVNSLHRLLRNAGVRGP